MRGSWPRWRVRARCLERELAQPLHQRVGQRGEQQAKLVGREAVAAGTGAEQIELRLLDAVLGLAAGAVQPLVQLYGVALEIGHHEARVVALAAVLEPGDHAPLDVPAVGRVDELVDQPLLDAAALVLVGQHQLGHSEPRASSRALRASPTM